MAYFSKTTRTMICGVLIIFLAVTLESASASDVAQFSHVRRARSVFHARQNPHDRFIVESSEKPAVNLSHLSAQPRTRLSASAQLTFNPRFFVCRNSTFNDSTMCLSKTLEYRRLFEATLRTLIAEYGFETTNTYNIPSSNITDSEDDSLYADLTPSCSVLKSNVHVLQQEDMPETSLTQFLPQHNLFHDIANITKCVIVSSAGSLYGSQLGSFIDSHDIVMRFNNAPTKGYEKDVGKKTTIRVLNSQVITKPEFNFLTSPLFQNVAIAAWDPGKYNNSLNDWLNYHDFNIFPNYEAYRTKYPQSNTFLIDPQSIWRLWKSIQNFFGTQQIRKNPPSSGFIGLGLLFPVCPEINYVEYIPSTRLDGRCHYYNRKINPTCTFGVWHPLAAEKLMALQMNSADNITVFQRGIISIFPPNQSQCG